VAQRGGGWKCCSCDDVTKEISVLPNAARCTWCRR
jgi:hypothetical protein